MIAFALFVSTLFGAAPARADAASDLALALRQERAGDAQAAVATLDEMVRRAPDGALADDALLHAGRILEERLGRPADALVRYRELTVRFARSRLARRAQARVDLLEAQLPAGEQAVVELAAILATPDAQLARGVARMERFLARRPEPDRALAERARLWLGGAYARIGRPGRALAQWERVVRDSHDRPAATRALSSIGDEYVALGRPDEAERAFGRLARLPGGAARAARGLQAVRRARIRRDVSRAAAGGVALFVVVLGLWVARRGGMRALAPSVEVAFLTPVFGLLLLLGWGALSRTDSSAPGAWQLVVALRGMAGIALGGIVLSHVGGAFARVVLAGERRRWVTVAMPTALALVSLSFVALVIEATGLGPFVLETLRAGATP